MTNRKNAGAASSDKRREAYMLGLRAETLAALRLRLTGWRIIERRFLAGGGEIDLVAIRGDCIAFVEVKARASVQAAAESITPQKMQRMRRAANAWLARNPWAARKTLRADAVFLAPRAWPRHEVNIFDLAD
ncbi:MAG: YraN family protein [Beijerinckiaceae bacterium]